MIERWQYCGFLKWPVDEAALQQACLCGQERIKAEIAAGRLLGASLYRLASRCFLYWESVGAATGPELFLGDLAPFMEPLPEVEGDVWAPMEAVYYHRVPTSVAEWEADRPGGGKRRIGRIAFLLPHKRDSYLYWHRALVAEGLFKGDKYQFISLHGNVLFSYYEEPKTMVSIRDSDCESELIGGWRNAVPREHFDRTMTNGENFLVIPALFSLGRGEK